MLSSTDFTLLVNKFLSIFLYRNIVSPRWRETHFLYFTVDLELMSFAYPLIIAFATPTPNRCFTYALSCAKQSMLLQILNVIHCTLDLPNQCLLVILLLRN